MELLKKVGERHMRKDLPDFRIGDTVKVSLRIVEGEKERIQAFTGVVIARRGGGISETFTVRRIVNNEGVERVFPIHNPRIVSIDVIRSGKVRRAKLYYLRKRVGKARRLKDITRSKPVAKAKAPEEDLPDESAEGEQAAEEGS